MARLGKLRGGVGYVIRVAAINGAGRGRWAPPVVAAPIAPPSVPLGLDARPGDRTVTLSWSQPAHPGGSAISRYELRHREVGDQWSALSSTTGLGTAISGLTNRQRYEFQLRAVNVAGPSAWQPIVSTPFDLVLPVLSIETEDAAPVVSKDDYLDARATLDPNGSAVDPYSGDLEIKGRGNSTWAQLKKPYRLKLESKSELLGMPENRHWALLANALDRSHLRNTTAFFLGEQTDLAWTPRTEYLEVVLNGEYIGLYQLTEQIRIDGDRVDIDEMSPDDSSEPEVTGGYLLELDERLEENGEYGFRTSEEVPIVLKDPEPDEGDDISVEDLEPQFDWIRNYIQEFEDELLAEGPYANYIDVESFIDWYLVSELTRNQDSNLSSVFMYKPRGDVLYKGPLWDFDLSMGSANVEIDPEGFYVKEGTVWYRELFKDPVFAEEVSDRWAELKPSFESALSEIDSLDAYLSEAIVNDSLRWNFVPLEADSPAFIKEWLSTRIEWLDDEL
jgi:hypothetical protein